MLAWLKKILPKWFLSGNTSACLGRLAPPESTKNKAHGDDDDDNDDGGDDGGGGGLLPK